MDQPSAIDGAERFARQRARIFPLLGILLIVADAVLSGPAPASWAARAPWLLMFVAGFVLVLSGGALPGRMRRLVEDESSAAARRLALRVGFIANVACLAGLLVTSWTVALTATQVLEIALTTAIAAPLISFGLVERRALG